jgi:hypothetical protein
VALLCHGLFNNTLNRLLTICPVTFGRITGAIPVETLRVRRMTKSNQIEKQANRIADAIVELVNRTDGPVTLSRIHREVPGFAKAPPNVWNYMLERDHGESVIWDGMTEAGTMALRKVMSGRRVAVQYVSEMPYLLEGGAVVSKNWLPVVLLPVKAANLDTPRWLIRGSKAYLDHAIAQQAAGGEQGYRLLTPGRVRCTADQFSA